MRAWISAVRASSSAVPGSPLLSRPSSRSSSASYCFCRPAACGTCRRARIVPCPLARANAGLPAVNHNLGIPGCKKTPCQDLAVAACPSPLLPCHRHNSPPLQPLSPQDILALMAASIVPKPNTTPAGAENCDAGSRSLSWARSASRTQAAALAPEDSGLAAASGMTQWSGASPRTREGLAGVTGPEGGGSGSST